MPNSTDTKDKEWSTEQGERELTKQNNNNKKFREQKLQKTKRKKQKKNQLSLYIINNAFITYL